MIRRAHLTWQIIRFQIQEFITDRFDEPDFLERAVEWTRYHVIPDAVTVLKFADTFSRPKIHLAA